MPSINISKDRPDARASDPWMDEYLARHKVADPLIEVVDCLDYPIAMLRTVYMALKNPDGIYGPDCCLETLIYALDRLEDLRDGTNSQVKTILGDL